jgi:hypothetical protein
MAATAEGKGDGGLEFCTWGRSPRKLLHKLAVRTREIKGSFEGRGRVPVSRS